MKEDKPFLKSFVVAGICYGLLIALAVLIQMDNLAFRFGRMIAPCFISALLIGITARQSKKHWSWKKVTGWTFVLVVILSAISNG